MNLKEQLCNYLIENNLVKEFDVIKHSYSNSRLYEWNKRNVEFNDMSPTLDTRCDCLGVVVRDGDDDMIINPLKGKSPYGWHFEQNVYDVNREVRSVKAAQGSGNILKIIEEKRMNNLRIRKLTPKECFRLMGVKDEDSGKLNHLSNSVKYHLAGDSIVVNVLEAIFKSILIDNPIVDEKPIRLIEFFAGYGSQALALKYLGIPFEHYVTCEWAIKSIDAYKHIHFPNINEDHTDLMDKDDLVDFLYEKGISSNWNEPMTREQIARKNETELRDIYNNCAITKNLINIQQVDGLDLEITEREHFNYILTYSFPCQDLSLAGKGAGMEKGSGTRSGMLWEVERILDELGEELPQILLMENVPQVVGKKNKEHFDKWINFLESKGYTNKYCMLNAKEVGYPEPIPQNRNRCFMISVLNPKCDIVFPEKTERKMVLKDVLEENVDEKCYLSEKMINFFYKNEQVQKEKGNGFRFGVSDGNVIAKTVTTRSGSRMDDNFIKIKNATKQGYLEAYDGDGVNISSRMKNQRGNVQKGTTQTLTTSGGNERGVVLEEKWADLD